MMTLPAEPDWGPRIRLTLDALTADGHNGSGPNHPLFLANLPIERPVNEPEGFAWSVEPCNRAQCILRNQCVDNIDNRNSVAFEDFSTFSIVLDRRSANDDFASLGICLRASPSGSISRDNRDKARVPLEPIDRNCRDGPSSPIRWHPDRCCLRPLEYCHAPRSVELDGQGCGSKDGAGE
jgi:hypothetical protein